MARTQILGTGHYLPQQIMTNDDWAKLVDTTDEWITTRTGIKERHIAKPEEATSDMVAEASRRAIADAGIKKEEIDMIIMGTVTPDTLFPSTANWVQMKLGLKPVPSMDVSAACCGFLFSMILADALIRTGMQHTVLVAGAETMTRIVNWEDRNTCVLFGDGAGAVILRADSSGKKGILSSYWNCDGNLGDLLMQPAGGSLKPASIETVTQKLHYVHMKGNEVFKHAVLRMEESAQVALKKADLRSEDISLFIPHQANIRIIEATVKRTKIPMEKTYICIDRIANISSATIPIGLDMARKEGRIKEGDKVLLAAFGAGFTWGGMALQF